jgi:phage protein D
VTARFLTPAVRLVAGQTVADSRDALGSTLTGLEVALSLDAAADSVTARLAGVERNLPQPGDAVTVRLGYTGDDLTGVFTGTVARAEIEPQSIRLIAHGAAASLLAATVDRTYTSVTAADIVRDLARQAGVTVTRTEPGGTFPAYVVDGRRSALHHAHDVAGLCGLQLYLDPDGGLVLERFTTGRTVHLYQYGQHLTRLDPWRRPAAADSVRAYGESPGTANGDQSWSWLVANFGASAGTAGSTAGPGLLLERAALRTADLARLAAQAELRRVQARAAGARITGVGRPEVALGDAVRLAGAGDADGAYQVRAVRHRLSRGHGFTTSAELWSIP